MKLACPKLALIVIATLLITMPMALAQPQKVQARPSSTLKSQARPVQSRPAQTRTVVRTIVLDMNSSEELLKAHIKPGDPAQIESFLLLAGQAYERQDFKTASQYFKQVLASPVKNERTPSNRCIATAGLAALEIADNNYTSGRAKLEEAIKLAPGLLPSQKPAIAELLAGYSELLYKTGYFEESEKLLNQAKTMYPSCGYCPDVTEMLAKADRNPDYMATQEKDVIRWSDDKQIIKVFISEPTGLSHWRGDYLDAAKKSFTKWENAIDGRLKFEYVDDPDLSDVRVFWLLKSPEGKELGLSEIKFTGQYMSQNDIKIFMQVEGGRFTSADEVYTTLLHEIGHMLGIRGHSHNYADVMAEESMAWILTKRDIETFRKFYAQEAKWTNPPNMTLGEYRVSMSKKANK